MCPQSSKWPYWTMWNHMETVQWAKMKLISRTTLVYTVFVCIYNGKRVIIKCHFLYASHVSCPNIFFDFEVMMTKHEIQHAYRGGKINRPICRCCPFGDPDNCIFHFYLSVDDLNPSGGALFAIKNVVPTCIKYILWTLWYGVLSQLSVTGSWLYSSYR